MADTEKDLVVVYLGGHETDDCIEQLSVNNLAGWKEGDEWAYVKRTIYLNEKGTVTDRPYYKGDGQWMSLEEAMKIMEKAQKKGATHVKFDYDEDHESYLFDFGILRLATQEESLQRDLEDEGNESEKNQARIKELEQELAKLKGE